MKYPLLFLLSCCLFCFSTVCSAEWKIVVLGDSLTAGYGLAQQNAFPAVLEKALRQKGQQVRVINAGISGDTSMGGLARADWALADNPDLLILELGANDALRGLEPEQTRQNLGAIITKAKAKNILTLLTGMKAPRNLGEDYYSRFDRIYPELADHHQIPFYPFFLDGVAGHPELNQTDGIHPNAAGVELIVERILPLVEKTLAQMPPGRRSINNQNALVYGHWRIVSLKEQHGPGRKKFLSKISPA